ncbi:hypothetical protein EI94DRAFT_1745973 [Lactarius quietus]|nr:hypothetical protein EI94DRAFT_1745973 [Lactarius quietus]
MLPPYLSHGYLVTGHFGQLGYSGPSIRDRVDPSNPSVAILNSPVDALTLSNHPYTQCRLQLKQWKSDVGTKTRGSFGSEDRRTVRLVKTSTL